jgi:hypothetical protein
MVFNPESFNHKLPFNTNMKEIENKITWNLNCVIKTRLYQKLYKNNFSS